MAVRSPGAMGRIDGFFIAVIGGLLLVGTLILLSAASPLPNYHQLLARHFAALLGGALIFALSLMFNYQIYQDQAQWLYFAALTLLVAVLFFGSMHKGHRSWFHLGALTFQPSEFARLVLVLVLAAFLDYREFRVRQFSTIVMAFGIAAPFVALILRQPDYSTAATFIPVVLVMLFCAGAKVSHLAGLIGFGLMATASPLLFTFLEVGARPAAGSVASFVLKTSQLGWTTAWAILGFTVLSLGAWRLAVMARLHPRARRFLAAPLVFTAGLLCGIVVHHKMRGYQRSRFVAYVAPQADLQGAAYHVRQSRIAIGSGGILGKGLFAGTQSQLGFLPERHTDFIYAVIGEELGFVGAAGILVLYLMLVGRLVYIGQSARDRFGYLVCAGLAAMLGCVLLLNVGMCVGMVPVVGIPLPMVSYGGSSLMMSLWGLGIAGNVYARRYALL